MGKVRRAPEKKMPEVDQGNLSDTADGIQLDPSNADRRVVNQALNGEKTSSSEDSSSSSSSGASVKRRKLKRTRSRDVRRKSQTNVQYVDADDVLGKEDITGLTKGLKGLEAELQRATRHNDALGQQINLLTAALQNSEKNRERELAIIRQFIGKPTRDDPGSNERKLPEWHPLPPPQPLEPRYPLPPLPPHDRFLPRYPERWAERW